MPNLSRRIVNAAGAALLLARTAQAQDVPPGKPVTILVPNPPGGRTDFAARLLAEPLSQTFGIPVVVVDNWPGANGNIAILATVRAVPGGHTLLLQYSGYHAGNPLLIRNAGWTERDLAPVGLATIGPHVILVAPDLPVRTLGEFVVYARAHPGQFNYGSAGNGSIQHIAGLRLAQAIGVEMVHVPYRGAAGALQDVAGGRMQLFITTPSSAIGLIQSNAVRPLAIAADARVSALPDVPTTAEAGLPGYTVEACFVVFAPADMPEGLVARLNAAMRQVAARPDVQKRAEEGGVTVRPLTIAEMATLAHRDVQEIGRIIQEEHVTLE